MNTPTTPAHCTRCSIPGYRCNEEEARIRRGVTAVAAKKARKVQR